MSTPQFVLTHEQEFLNRVAAAGELERKPLSKDEQTLANHLVSRGLLAAENVKGQRHIRAYKLATEAPVATETPADWGPLEDDSIKGRSFRDAGVDVDVTDQPAEAITYPAPAAPTAAELQRADQIKFGHCHPTKLFSELSTWQQKQYKRVAAGEAVVEKPAEQLVRYESGELGPNSVREGSATLLKLDPRLGRANFLTTNTPIRPHVTFSDGFLFEGEVGEALLGRYYKSDLLAEGELYRAVDPLDPTVLVLLPGVGVAFGWAVSLRAQLLERGVAYGMIKAAHRSVNVVAYGEGKNEGDSQLFLVEYRGDGTVKQHYHFYPYDGTPINHTLRGEARLEQHNELLASVGLPPVGSYDAKRRIAGEGFVVERPVATSTEFAEAPLLRVNRDEETLVYDEADALAAGLPNAAEAAEWNLERDGRALLAEIAKTPILADSLAQTGNRRTLLEILVKRGVVAFLNGEQRVYRATPAGLGLLAAPLPAYYAAHQAEYYRARNFGQRDRVAGATPWDSTHDGAYLAEQRARQERLASVQLDRARVAYLDGILDAGLEGVPFTTAANVLFEHRYLANLGFIELVADRGASWARDANQHPARWVGTAAGYKRLEREAPLVDAGNNPGEQFGPQKVQVDDMGQLLRIETTNTFGMPSVTTIDPSVTAQPGPAISTETPTDADPTGAFYAVDFRTDVALVVPFTSAVLGRQHVKQFAEGSPHVVADFEFNKRFEGNSFLAQQNLAGVPYRVVTHLDANQAEQPQPVPTKPAPAAPAPVVTPDLSPSQLDLFPTGNELDDELEAARRFAGGWAIGAMELMREPDAVKKVVGRMMNKQLIKSQYSEQTKKSIYTLTPGGLALLEQAPAEATPAVAEQPAPAEHNLAHNPYPAAAGQRLVHGELLELAPTLTPTERALVVAIGYGGRRFDKLARTEQATAAQLLELGAVFVYNSGGLLNPDPSSTGATAGKYVAATGLIDIIKSLPQNHATIDAEFRANLTTATTAEERKFLWSISKVGGLRFDEAEKRGQAATCAKLCRLGAMATEPRGTFSTWVARPSAYLELANEENETVIEHADTPAAEAPAEQTPAVDQYEALVLSPRAEQLLAGPFLSKLVKNQGARALARTAALFVGELEQRTAGGNWIPDLEAGGVVIEVYYGRGPYNLIVAFRDASQRVEVAVGLETSDSAFVFFQTEELTEALVEQQRGRLEVRSIFKLLPADDAVEYDTTLTASTGIGSQFGDFLLKLSDLGNLVSPAPAEAPAEVEVEESAPAGDRYGAGKPYRNVFGYEFNEHDVCTNPTVVFQLDAAGGKDRVEITVAQAGHNRWVAGYSYGTKHNSMGASGPVSNLGAQSFPSSAAAQLYRLEAVLADKSFAEHVGTRMLGAIRKQVDKLQKELGTGGAVAKPLDAIVVDEPAVVAITATGDELLGEASAPAATQWVDCIQPLDLTRYERTLLTKAYGPGDALTGELQDYGINDKLVAALKRLGEMGLLYTEIDPTVKRYELKAETKFTDLGERVAKAALVLEPSRDFTEFELGELGKLTPAGENTLLNVYGNPTYWRSLYDDGRLENDETVETLRKLRLLRVFVDGYTAEGIKSRATYIFTDRGREFAERVLERFAGEREEARRQRDAREGKVEQAQQVEQAQPLAGYKGGLDEQLNDDLNLVSVFFVEFIDKQIPDLARAMQLAGVQCGAQYHAGGPSEVVVWLSKGNRNLGFDFALGGFLRPVLEVADMASYIRGGQPVTPLVMERDGAVGNAASFHALAGVGELANLAGSIALYFNLDPPTEQPATKAPARPSLLDLTLELEQAEERAEGEREAKRLAEYQPTEEERAVAFVESFARAYFEQRLGDLNRLLFDAGVRFNFKYHYLGLKGSDFELNFEAFGKYVSDNGLRIMSPDGSPISKVVDGNRYQSPAEALVIVPQLRKLLEYSVDEAIAAGYVLELQFATTFKHNEFAPLVAGSTEVDKLVLATGRRVRDILEQRARDEQAEAEQQAALEASKLPDPLVESFVNNPPAFPSKFPLGKPGDGELVSPGISRHLYLAAHAPAVIPEWYQPNGARPTWVESTDIEAALVKYAGNRALEPGDVADALAEAREERETLARQWDIKRAASWPNFWAEIVLADREKSGNI